MLVCLSAAAVGLVAFRVLYTHSLLHASFLWNLALAWIPFVLALVVYDRAARHRGRSVVAVAGLWLLFFPNAPYIVTDFVHLRGSDGLAFWYDLVLIGTIATTVIKPRMMNTAQKTFFCRSKRYPRARTTKRKIETNRRPIAIHAHAGQPLRSACA